MGTTRAALTLVLAAILLLCATGLQFERGQQRRPERLRAYSAGAVAGGLGLAFVGVWTLLGS